MLGALPTGLDFSSYGSLLASAGIACLCLGVAIAGGAFGFPAPVACGAALVVFGALLTVRGGLLLRQVHRRQSRLTEQRIAAERARTRAERARQEAAEQRAALYETTRKPELEQDAQVRETDAGSTD
ncbi:hypothetical protein ACOZ4N_16520 [Halorientalis pallida]|uniref:hypothetical protein n=1 Tax=Halorientalis pallida TaxID=2479928 RepID=UPI003C704578